MELKLKYYFEDTGFCRIYYKSETRRLYCKQNDYGNVFNWYFCTPEGEPDTYLKEGLNILIVKSFKDNEGQREVVRRNETLIAK